MKWLKEEIEFNRKEFLGITALMVIGLIILVIQFFPLEKEQVYDITIEDILIEKEEATTLKTVEKYRKKNPKKYKHEFKQPEKRVFQKFKFNPNVISVDSLMKLGFKKRVAQTWVKFRGKGKKFDELDDVLSIYGIDTNLVFKLKEQFQFDKKKFKPKVYPKSERKVASSFVVKPMDPVDLNSCTEEDLKKLGGIGQIYASRILKYRELLGGYASKDQLLNVYGLHDSTFQVIKEFVQVKSPPELIKVNTASKKQLSEHILVDYKTAKLIWAYRKEHGPFVDKLDFESIKGVPEQKKNEIIPYLNFAL